MVGHRAHAKGKFLFEGLSKSCIRGVTYGPFRPDSDTGCEYHSPEIVVADFALMARNGINAIRTYTVPPIWLLDAAAEAGLRVMVGLPWEQHVAFLHDRKLSRSIESRIRSGVRRCAGHPALLGYAIGNEVPTGVVRWHGHRRALLVRGRAADPLSEPAHGRRRHRRRCATGDDDHPLALGPARLGRLCDRRPRPRLL